MSKRADAGKPHAMSPAGREACSLAATRHGVWRMVEGGMMPRCATCPSAVRERCPSPDENAPTCPLLGGFRAQLLDSLQDRLAERGGHLESYEWPLVCEYAKTLCVLLRIDQVIEAEGMETTEVRDVAKKPGRAGEAYAVKTVALGLHPLLSVRKEWSALALKQAEALGLSPAGRKKLEIESPVEPPKSLADLAGDEPEPEGGAK